MKKYTKTMIVVLLMVVTGLGYYYYLANRAPSVDATQQSIDNPKLASLTAKDISLNYPQAPKEVVKLYAEITKAYYETNTTDEQVAQLGKQARVLFDDELKGKQTEAEFLDALQREVSSYREISRYISDFKIEGSSNTKYTTMNGKDYASINLVYYIRDNSKLQYSYNRFVLRKDAEGRWKILYWELISPEDIKE